MAWVKIPKEHHPIFLEALPEAPDVETITMFGGVGAMVNGNMAGGLFGRSVMVRLPEVDQQRVLAMEGGAPFDPMGNGRTMKDTVMLPEDVMEDGSLRGWLERAIAYTRTLPPKAKKGGSAKKAAPKKAVVKKAVVKKAATKQGARKKR
ncbi:MAG: TfoX/Sxy family protein [Myxococcota bacterium]